MRPEGRDADHLRDMFEYARAIARSIQGLTLEDYLRDSDLRMATERRVEIIGEAASRISEEFQSAHREIPWRKVVAQRNVLAHEYGDIDDEILWGVATVSIPELILQLEPLIDSPSPGA